MTRKQLPAESDMMLAEESRLRSLAEDIGLEEATVPLGRRIMQWSAVVAGCGMLAIGGGFGFWELTKKSGEIEQIAPKNPTDPVIQEGLRLASFNVQGRPAHYSKQIDHQFKSKGLSAVALQEVTADGVKQLHKKLPNYYITFVYADRKQHYGDGGYGDAIVTQQQPTDLRSAALPGSGFLESVFGAAKGGKSDIAGADVSLTNTKDGVQETRAAVAETIRVFIGGKLVKARIMTTHITSNAYPELHNRQFSDVLKFASHNTLRGQVNVICGDFNAGMPEIIERFQGTEYYPPTHLGPTSLGNGEVIDHCAFDFDGVKGFGTPVVSAENNPHSDHRFLYARTVGGTNASSEPSATSSVNQGQVAQKPRLLRVKVAE